MGKAPPKSLQVTDRELMEEYGKLVAGLRARFANPSAAPSTFSPRNDAFLLKSLEERLALMRGAEFAADGMASRRWRKPFDRAREASSVWIHAMEQRRKAVAGGGAKPLTPSPPAVSKPGTSRLLELHRARVAALQAERMRTGGKSHLARMEAAAEQALAQPHAPPRPSSPVAEAPFYLSPLRWSKRQLGPHPEYLAFRGPAEFSDFMEGLAVRLYDAHLTPEQNEARFQRMSRRQFYALMHDTHAQVQKRPGKFRGAADSIYSRVLPQPNDLLTRLAGGDLIAEKIGDYVTFSRAHEAHAPSHVSLNLRHSPDDAKMLAKIRRTFLPALVHRLPAGPKRLPQRKLRA